jgi:hypothetical protein
MAGPEKEDASKTSAKSASPSEKENPDEEKETKEESSDESPKSGLNNTRLPWVIFIFFGLIFLGGLFYYFWDRSPPPPATLPPPQATKTSDDFFMAFREAIQETADGKSYYGAAQGLMAWDESGIPSTMPTTLPTETSNAPQLSKAAENYAKAVEHFRHARQLVENTQLDRTEEDLETCKKNFTQTIDRYADAADTLNQISKSLRDGTASKEQLVSATDAKAKYETADQILSKSLMEGCGGEFFKFVKSKNNMEKSLIYTAYKNFFGGNFEPQRSIIELLLNYKPPSESSSGGTKP